MSLSTESHVCLVQDIFHYASINYPNLIFVYVPLLRIYFFLALIT